MNLQTFRATTMAEALTQVKSHMGSDAVILHTRTFHTRYFLGLRRREMVEITAGKGLNLPDRHSRRQIPSRQPQNASGPAAYRNASNQAQLAAAVPRNAQEGSRVFMETPAASSAAILGVSAELVALKTMVKDLVQQTRVQQAPQVPEEMFEYYTQLISQSVAEELASEIVKNVQRNSRPENLLQPEFVRERITEQLEKMIPTAGPITKTKLTGPHIVALVGPTGVGKTTTLAKLAANLKLREKHKVGLITLDTYRIAAIDQLKKYADILGSPLKVVNSGEELRDAVTGMGECDFILIDTAGRSPNDTLKINELKNLLATVEPDEVHLVLSSTSSESCIELAATRFAEVRVDKIIFTKVDEAAHVGVVFNVVRKLNKNLSYITTGQDVPDDIEVGRGRRLAQLILGSGL